MCFVSQLCVVSELLLEYHSGFAIGLYMVLQMAFYFTDFV